MEDKDIRDEHDNDMQMSKGLLINIGISIVTGVIVGSFVSKRAYNNGAKTGYVLGYNQGSFDILSRLR